MKLEKLRLKEGGKMLSKNKQIFIVDDDVWVKERKVVEFN